MTATSQHGFHPDAESLSAFSEQALGERERAEVLAHLAVCGRCRQVVALAREAADAGAENAAAPPRKAIEPNAWWKQWRLVWVPTAIVAAFAAASISVYIEQADRHGTNIKIAEQNPTQGATSPAAPSPTEQAKVEPPAAAAPATPPVRPAKHAHSAAPEPPPAPAPPVVAAQMPSESDFPEPGAPAPGVTHRVEVMREAPPMSHAEEQQSPPQLTMGIHGSAYSQPASGAWEAKQKRAEEQRRAEVDTSRMRSFKAKAAPFAVRGANAAPPAGATQTVTVTAAPPLETQPAATAEPAPMLGIKSSWDVTTPSNPIQLPSGLASVSIASRGHFLLAIDKAGALFLSEDRGVTWERITTQWTGRAVEVRRQARDHGAPQAAPTAQNGTTGNSSADAGAASPPLVSFELSNDNNQTWVSTDGRTWTPK
ncbi:MAG: zf-HC2 domain-containing protein [Terracidiphilus sp.]